MADANQPFADEGRVLTAVFHFATIVCVYAPNPVSRPSAAELRPEWDAWLASSVSRLRGFRTVVVGDINGLLDPKDTAYPEDNISGLGDELSSTGHCDLFRVQHPNAVGE